MIRDDRTAAVLPAAQQAWEEIEDTLDAIAQLAKSGLPAREFHREVLDRLVRALAAVGGAIWLADESLRLRPDYQIRLDQTLPARDAAGRQQHARLLEGVLRREQGLLIPPHAGDDQARNPTALLLILCPLTLPGRALGIIEILQRPEPQPDVQRGYLRVVTAASELVGDYHRDRQLQALGQRQSLWNQWREFSEAVHCTLDLDATAGTIANDGRRLIGCDRVSVLVRRGQRCRLLAISGVDSFQKRASSVRQLETLARQVLKLNEAVWHPEQTAELPPQVASLIDAYVDETQVRWIAVLPLRTPSRGGTPASPPHGALIVERFDARPEDELRERVHTVCGQAASALKNAVEHESIPFLPLWRLVQRVGWLFHWRQLPKTVVVLAALTALVLALVKVPADFEISARGELQPLRRYHVFAPQDGVVVELPQTPGATVQSGDILATLSNPRLDIEFTEVLGKRRTTEEQLAAVRAARMRSDSASPTRDRHELSSQEEQLKEKLQGLEQQYQILAAERRQLQVRSPTAGQVLTWDLERTLAARPVQRGEKLMTVADLDGPWELELRIGDDQAGHVLAAQQQSGPQLPVSFILATDPGVTYAGHLRELGTATEVDDSGRPTLFALVDLPAASVPQPRPGATVIAKIHCGRRALGYVWLRQIFEAIQSRLLF